MHVSVPAILQDSRVAPSQIAARFRAHGEAMPSWIQGAIRRPVVDRFGVQGLGDLYCDELGCYDTTTSQYLLSTTTGGTTATSTTPTSTTDWTSILNTLAKSGTTLAAESMLSPGVSVSPTGAVSQQMTGYPIGTGVATAISGISSTTMLLIAGAALLLFAMKGK